MDTTKSLIIANAKRVIELLDADAYNAELYRKMHELRRDTLRLEGLKKNLIRPCNTCMKEFKATNSYEYQCYECKYQIKEEYRCHKINHTKTSH